MKLKNPQVTGTYAGDIINAKFGQVVWYRVHGLKPMEAARRLGFNVKSFTPEEKALVSSEQWYPFLNKGYVVVDRKSGLLTEESQATPQSQCPIGAEAIYLHDGRFSIVRKRRLVEFLNGVAQTRSCTCCP